jgi:hypothetical protein
MLIITIARLVLSIKHACKSKVTNLGSCLLSFSLVDEDIFWFEVSMKNIILMDLGHSIDNLREYLKVMLSIYHILLFVSDMEEVVE